MKVEQLIDDILFRIGDPNGSMYPRESVRRTLNRVYQQLNLQLRVLQREVTFDPQVNPLNKTQIMVIGTDMSLNNASTNRDVAVTIDGVSVLDNTYAGATSADDWISDLQALIDVLSYVTMTTVVNAGITEITLTFGEFPYAQHTIEFTETITDALPGSLVALISHQAYLIPDYFDLPLDWHMPYKMDSRMEFVYPSHYKVNARVAHVYTIENGQVFLSGAEVEGFTPVTFGYWSVGKELVEKATDVTIQTESPEYRPDLHDVLFYGGAIETSGNYPQFQMDMIQFNQRKIDLSRSVKVLSDTQAMISPWIRQGVDFKVGYGAGHYYGPKPYLDGQDD